MYVSRNTFERHVDLLLIRKKGKRHYYLIKDFIACSCATFLLLLLTSVYHKRNIKCHLKHFFKINGKQLIKTIKNKVNMSDSNVMAEK